MKIAWFTPFSAKSAIGRYSKYAAQALSNWCDVDILTFERDELNQTNLKVIFFNGDSASTVLRNYDLAVYNMGDSRSYHAPVFEAALRNPGVFIVHDATLHNFMRDYFVGRDADLKNYTKVITKLYGEKAAEMLLKAADSLEDWNRLDLTRFSMSELLFPRAYGIIVHSEYHKSKLSPMYKGLLDVVPLVDMSEFTVTENLPFDGYPADKLNILTVGNVNYNKRIHSMLDAIASSDLLRKKVCYTCIGSLENKPYTDMLNDKIAKDGLSENVRLLGFVPHSELAQYYMRADVISNLRYPAFEGSSASLQEQMLMGKSVLVSDTGVYAEMPDDCVFKINPENEAAELRSILEKLAGNPLILAAYGEKAKAKARELFSRENYGRRLYDFLRRVQFTLPLQRLTDMLCAELAVMGVSPDMALCANVSNEIEHLFKSPA